MFRPRSHCGFSPGIVILLLFALLVSLPQPLLAQGQAQASEPVVTSVFFYSPYCPHCHTVLDEHWPSIEAEFGTGLRTLFVDVSTDEGSAIMSQSLAYLGMEPTGVPMLLVGNQVLVGSLDIPERAPTVIRQGLEAGGVTVLPIPSLLSRLDAVIAQTSVLDQTQPELASAASENTSSSAPTTGRTADALNADQEAAAAPVASDAATALAAMDAATTRTTVWQRIVRDPIANAVAIVVLLLSAGTLTLYALQRLQKSDGFSRWSRAGAALRPWMLAVTALLGVGLSVTVLAGATGSTTILLLALVNLVAFALLLASLFVPAVKRLAPRWMVPVVAGAGMVVATYLAYVEATANPAVCGVIGECNTVQQSVYASILGVPIGVLGMAGYALILGVALLRNWAPDWLGAFDIPLLEGMAVVGVAFSTYLTFLEPFVIGATCAWCLLSALWMLALLWLVMRWEPTTKEASPRNTPRSAAGRNRNVKRSHGHA